MQVNVMASILIDLSNVLGIKLMSKSPKWLASTCKKGSSSLLYLLAMSTSLLVHMENSCEGNAAAVPFADNIMASTW